MTPDKLEAAAARAPGNKRRASRANGRRPLRGAVGFPGRRKEFGALEGAGGEGRPSGRVGWWAGGCRQATQAAPSRARARVCAGLSQAGSRVRLSASRRSSSAPLGIIMWPLEFKARLAPVCSQNNSLAPSLEPCHSAGAARSGARALTSRSSCPLLQAAKSSRQTTSSKLTKRAKPSRAEPRRLLSSHALQSQRRSDACKWAGAACAKLASACLIDSATGRQRGRRRRRLKDEPPPICPPPPSPSPLQACLLAGWLACPTPAPTPTPALAL